MTSLVLIHELGESIRLGRRSLTSGSPAWPAPNGVRTGRQSVAADATVQLGDVSFVYLAVDGTIKIGWTDDNGAHEIDVVSLALLSNTMTAAYIRNAGASAVDVSVVFAN